MGDLNRASLLGRLGKDPEIRQTAAGEKVASFSVATGERWKDKATGEKKERTEWHSIVLFGPLAAIAEQYLHKGSRVYVEGAIRTRKWQDQSGNDRWSTEVVLSGFGSRLDILDGKSEGGGRDEGRDEAYDVPGRGAEGAGRGGGSGSSAEYDDEIPF